MDTEILLKKLDEETLEFRRELLREGSTSVLLTRFQNIIYSYYQSAGRQFPWRSTDDPYRILVSEIMLQQTQTSRVVEKYLAFIELFPDAAALAASPLEDVLKAWQGLGYNRRAIALKKTAEIIATQLQGKVPEDPEELEKLPGIGPATASAIAAFAFNRPVIFIETNTRAVFIHFFFQDQDAVPDKEILPLVEKTLDANNPRHWYYALMDYGVMLKKVYRNPGRKSAHHIRQSPFEGSDRQLRGGILRFILENTGVSREDVLREMMGKNGQEDRVRSALTCLEKEGFIREDGGILRIR